MSVHIYDQTAEVRRDIAWLNALHEEMFGKAAPKTTEVIAMTESTPVVEKKFTERCQAPKQNWGRCKCYGIMQVNGLWYCKQHGEAELRKAVKA